METLQPTLNSPTGRGTVRRFLATLGIACALGFALDLAGRQGHVQPLVLSELFCLFAALSTACACWLSRAWRTALPNYFGPGFLLAAFLNAVQTCLLLGLLPPPAASPSLIHLPGLLERALASCLLLAAAYLRSASLTRRGWQMLIVLLASSLCPVYLLPTKHALGYLSTLTGVAAATWLACSSPGQPDEALGDERFPLLLAAGLMIGSQLAHTSDLLNDLPNGLGHCLRISSYAWLMETVMLAVVVWPQKELDAGLRRGRSILNALPYAVATADGNGVVSFVNDAMASLFGLPAQGFLGYPLRESIERLRKLGFEIRFEASAEQSSPNQVVVLQGPPGLPRHWYAERLPLLQGGTVILMREARRETDLTALRAETRSILDSLGDLVLLADNQDRVITANVAFRQFSGLAGDQLEGCLLGELLQQMQLNDAFRLPYTDTAEPLSCQLRATDGTAIETLLRLVDIRDLEGLTIGRILVASDITELKREEARLHQHSKLILLGEMTTGMIHEIRNPLTAIKGFTQLVMRELTDPRLRRFTEIMEREIGAVERIINNYLLSSNPGAPDLRSRPVSEVTGSLATVCERVARLHETEFACVLTAPEGLVAVDLGQLAQMALNMAQNACEAMQGVAHPRLQLLVSAADEYVRISIKDNGPGIDLADLSRLGTPFFTTKASGTGLGLSVCYQIARAHAGHVEAESQPGVGTTFHVLLPLAGALVSQ